MLKGLWLEMVEVGMKVGHCGGADVLWNHQRKDDLPIQKRSPRKGSEEGSDSKQEAF